VTFSIPQADVAAEIITDFSGLSEGPHTLTLVAVDLSGKEASFMYNFIKDVTPPSISFTNIDNENDKSKVDNNWWAKSSADRHILLAGNNTTPPLPLSTIYYEMGSKPVLTGAFADDISNIAIEIGAVLPADGSNINKYNPPDGSFRYWIDTDVAGSAREYAVIDGSGRNVRWSIYLTDNGTEAGNALPDGVHTIVIEVADTSGVKNNYYQMIAFRIDSKQPVAAIGNKASLTNSVFGSSTYQDDPVFTIKGKASDANLKVLELSIVDKDTTNPITINGSPVVSFDIKGAVYNPLIPVPPAAAWVDDKVELDWTYDVNKTLFDSLINGKSYDVIVTAIDQAGNESTQDVWTFTVDTTPPKIEFTNPTDTNPNGTVNTLVPADFIDVPTLAVRNSINRLTSENLKIQGKVTDAFWNGNVKIKDGTAVKELQSLVEKWNWNTGAWVVIETWKDVRDLSTNKFNEINWTKNLLGQETGDLDIRAIDPDTTNNPNGEGLYRIQLRAKDESFTKNGTNTWNLVSDSGNPVLSDYLYFYYDRTNPTLKIDGEMDNFYSTSLTSSFKFAGNVTDNNRFAKVQVGIWKVPVGNNDKAIDEKPASLADIVTGSDPGPNTRERELKWNVEFTGVTDNKYPDGRYRIIATVSDMTGREYSVTKDFTLDNTPPGAKFTGPSKVNYTKKVNNIEEKIFHNGNDSEGSGFASAIVSGGESAVITGETWDKSSNNSESGIDQMWFHLGFLDNNTAFPTRAQIKADEDRIIGLVKGLSSAQVAGLSVSDRNKYMDDVSEYPASGDADTKGNAWFKLGGTQVPKGFVINTKNIYDWRMEIPSTHPVLGQIGGLKLYGSDINVKGRDYKIVKGSIPNDYPLQMARAVEPIDAGGQAGVYRLPLWIRLVDKVGNVEYYCHDIFFYPDGDIPTTSIENPTNGTKGEARGGAISVDGVASSNTSVYDVVFRVYADGTETTNLKSPAPVSYPLADDVITMPSSVYEFVTIGSDVYNIIASAGYATTNLPNTQNSRWYKANLMLKGGAGEPLIPWSVIINSDGEISDLIPKKGFAAKEGSVNPDTIRVWLEVFVFNGEGAPIRSSIYGDDGDNTAGGVLYGTAGTPKPYVRAFYIKSSAPAITHPDVGSWDGSKFVWNAANQDTVDPAANGYKGPGTEVRRNSFAVRAVLDPSPTGSSGLGEVSFRTRLNSDSYSGWKTAWSNDAPLNVNGVKINVRNVGANPARTRYNFEYAIDSKATADTAAFAVIRNNFDQITNWQNTGGTITVQVRIRDKETPPNEAEQTIVVGVDNFAPVADPEARTNPKVAGTNVDFMGRVYDYARPVNGAQIPDAMTDTAPRKVDRVYAWFTKTVNGQERYININTGARAAAPSSGTRTMAALDGRAAAVVYGNNDTITSLTLTNRGTTRTITYPALGGQQAHNADWVREISSSTAIPGTKMLWAPVNSMDYDIRWQFTVDTTVLPDGKMTLHYIVVDSAVLRDANGNEMLPGNASYYTQEISVRNKYPAIDRVTLYTDNNGIGAVYTTHPDNNIASTEYVLNEYRNKGLFANYTDPADYTAPGKLDSVGYLNSGFISKNQYIGFKVETMYGNRDLNFRLQYVTRERIRLTRTNLIKMVADRNAEDPAKINLYTIAWHGDYSNAKWRTLGVPVDNPMLGTHFVLQMAKVPDDYDLLDECTAEVWKYTAVKTRSDVTPTGQPQDDTVVFGPADSFEFNTNKTTENNFASIPELNGSHPDYGTGGDLTPDNPKATAFFLIRVWDTVNPKNSPEYGGNSERWVNDQLFDAVVVGMNVYLSDTKPPTVRLYDPNPYAETAVVGNNVGNGTDPVTGASIPNTELTIRNALNPKGIGQNILRGGLYNVKTERQLVKSGHIEPRSGTGALSPRVKNPVTRVYETLTADGFVSGDLPTNTVADYGTLTRDLVSGKVILRGSSWDDQLIREIRVNIGTGNAPPANLHNVTAGQSMAILRLDTTVGSKTYLTLQPVNGAKAWAAEELHWKTGHTAEWAYVWDTETIPNSNGTPASDIKVWVAAIDHLGSSKTGLPSTNTVITTDTESTETFKNSITVDILPYITGIERDPAKYTTTRSLQGWYSFFRGEQNVSIVGYNLKGSGNSSLTIRHGPSATTPPAITGTQTINKITFTVPDNAQSGKIILNTNVTLGNSTEALNHRSNDKQSWNRESHYYTDGSDLWINKPYAHIWRTTDSDTAPRTYMGSKTVSATSGSAGLNHPGMALEYAGGSSGTLHGTWAVYGYANVYYGANNNTNNNLVGATPGEPYATPDISIFQGGGRAAANVGYSYQGDGDAYLMVKAVVNGTGGGNNISGSVSGNPTQRWQNIRISKALANTNDNETNVGRIYMTAFDARYNCLWYGSRNGTSNATMTIDGGTGGATMINANNGTAAAASAGQFSAVDYDNVGPVIAYYDQEHDTVRLALGLYQTPTNGATQWNRKYLLDSGHALYRGSGRYVSIKVDKNNGIHLAFFNSVRSTVVYAYATGRNAAFTAYAIDDVVKGGTWTDISVDDNGNPWIVYGDNSRTGNYDGARIAYRSGSGTTTGIEFVRPKNDPVTGTTSIKGWEAVSMPAQYTINNDRLNIEAWPPTNRSTGNLGAAPGWNAAIGYASDMYRIGYFFYPAYKDGNY
jgi:hypothetical protein